ncbi:ArsR/SmtB family transcription factor [Pseudodesulfovibrio piezophilus]|nr:metalloregulator ArsR/SmtB family transcription factor [Pseudodesulfovibrio piezophilus]
MEQLAERLKGLSDPTRLRLLALLDCGELCICDLMEALSLPQSKVSRHMSFLKKSGWVTSHRKGKWVYYTLADPDDQLQVAILTTLREYLPNLAVGAEDHERLKQYLKIKNADSCG